MSRRRVARAVASLWQGVTPRAHGRRASRRLDPEAEDGGEHDDGRVSVAMKTNKSLGSVAVSPGVDRQSKSYSLNAAVMAPKGTPWLHMARK